jgi:hypothetical protein
MRAMRRLVWVLWAVAACSFDASGVGGGSGSIDAPPGAADANVDAMVDASTVGCSCAGNTLKCTGQPDQSCSLGCSMASGAHCEALVPSNGVSLTELNAATAALATTPSSGTTTSHDYVINTDTGEIDDYGDDGFPNNTPTVVRAAGTGANGGIVFDTIGPTISVLAVDNVDFAANSTVYGFGTRALVILSRGDVSIQGDVDFSAGCYDAGGAYDPTCAGPGGGAGGTNLVAATGCGAGGAGLAGHFTGGGGGAMGAVGGAGGDFSGGNKGGPGGSVAACPDATLVPLAGGSGGGVGAAGTGGFGGGGGGALQITSLTKIGLTHPGVASTPTEIYVGGSGGRGTPTTDDGGGGGGAGGGILLEAPMVVVHATLAANGAGGGGGRVTGASADGQMGTTSVMQALGGVGDGTGMNTGRGGFGGAAAGAASQGVAGADGTGGGGGAIGRIRINTKGPADTAGGTISPNAATGPIVVQ